MSPAKALMTAAGVAVAVAASVPAAAQSTCSLPVAAYLTDTAGAPLAGELDVELRFYVEEGPDALPVECRSTSTSVDDGWLRFLLDACDRPAPGDCGVVSLDSLFASSDAVWVGFRIGDSDSELSPRQLVGAVPYAVHAASADEATTAGHADTASRADTAGHADTADVATALEGFDPADYEARLAAVEDLLADSDGDGWFDLVDNCPDLPSADLTDTDGDGVGDECDECEGGSDTVDTDGDGVADACERCPGEDDALDVDGDGIPDCLGDGTDFGGWTWVEGPRGGSCLGVCETIGLSCVDLAGTGWVETAETNICHVFYPGLSTRSDGDGPRLSSTNPDGSPSPSSQCVYHSHDWSGATCAWVERADDVRFCPCT